MNAKPPLDQSMHVWSRGVAQWFRQCLSVADPFVSVPH
jgi:hypothetical protein